MHVGRPFCRYTIWRPRSLHSTSITVFVGQWMIEGSLPPCAYLTPCPGVHTHTYTHTHTHKQKSAQTHKNNHKHTRTDTHTHTQTGMKVCMHVHHATPSPKRCMESLSLYVFDSRAYRTAWQPWACMNPIPEWHIMHEHGHKFGVVGSARNADNSGSGCGCCLSAAQAIFASAAMHAETRLGHLRFSWVACHQDPQS